MISLQEHAGLAALNTFGLPGMARWLAEVDSAADIAQVVRDPRFQSLPRVMLGSGSNLVLRGGELEALVIRLRAGGWRESARDGNRVRIVADAGLAWHALVTDCVAAGLGGIENLALIPGTVGAAPVQNIGAYGVELESVLHAVETVHLHSGEMRTWSRAECRFGYRDSVFKHEARDRAITAVHLDLATDAPLALDYRDLREELAARGNPPATRQLVYDMVCAIRRRKLPDPAQVGNAGSFFKNPLVSAEQFAGLRERFPDIVGYPQAGGDVKVAAGWLIDRAGWKGQRAGAVGVHDRQALVLVNCGGARGEEVLALAARIVADVQARYGITLEMEPRVL